MKASVESKIKRKDLVLAGAYDGRYRTKVVKDKKKHESKTGARKKWYDD